MAADRPLFVLFQTPPSDEEQGHTRPLTKYIIYPGAVHDGVQARDDQDSDRYRSKGTWPVQVPLCMYRVLSAWRSRPSDYRHRTDLPYTDRTPTLYTCCTPWATHLGPIRYPAVLPAVHCSLPYIIDRFR